MASTTAYQQPGHPQLPSPTAYPTPPPTSSPKQSPQQYQFSSKGAAVDYYGPAFQTQVTPYPQADAKNPAVRGSSYPAPTDGTLPADTVSNTLPNAHQHGHSLPTPTSPTRKSSRPNTPAADLAYPPRNSPYRPSTPSARPSSRPLSPLHRTRSPLSPYNASRPRPRAGLQRALLDRCTAFGAWLLSIGKANPLLAGVLTFVPVVLGAVAYKIYRGLGGDKNNRGNSVMAKLFGVLGGGGGAAAGRGAPKRKGVAEELFRDFRGMGGAKAEKGMLHGAVRLVQMLVNHLCKLTLHPFPRTASILCDLYFLEHDKSP